MTASRDVAPAAQFSPLAAETLRAIAASGVVRQFPKNAVLINGASTATRCSLSCPASQGLREQRGRQGSRHRFPRSRRIRGRDVAGRLAALRLHHDRRADHLAVVGRAHFREFILDHPDFALHLIEMLIRRVRHDQREKPGALRRLWAARPAAAVACGRARLAASWFPSSQQDIAERVGLRGMISRLMKDLVGGGYLSIEERTITILRKPPRAGRRQAAGPAPGAGPAPRA